MTGKTPVIAIIDDDPSVRDATAGLLESLGYIATTFASAEEYLRSDVVNTAACVISDIKMPGMSGMELQARLQSDGVHTPVIFMTAFPTEQLRDRAAVQGAYGYLKKPFGERALIACLRRALAQSETNSD